MTVSAWWFANAFVTAFLGEMDVENASELRVMLLDNSNLPSQDDDDYISDVDGDEVSGTGYTAEGMDIGSPNIDSAANVITLDGDNSTWSSSTITAQFAVVYANTGTNTTSPCLCFVDFGQEESSSSGDFTIAWNASGIATITPADYS